MLMAGKEIQQKGKDGASNHGSEKVRRFADELHRFNTDLENRIILLQARFSALGDTWQDQEHEKFAEEFKLAMKALKKFNELSKEHTPYLLRKAQRIEEYLRQH